MERPGPSGDSVGIEASPFGVIAARLASADEYDECDERDTRDKRDEPVRVRFTARLTRREAVGGGHLFGEPALESALSGGSGSAADSIREIICLGDPTALETLLDSTRVPATERSVRAAVRLVSNKARVCAWEAAETRPDRATTVELEHGLMVPSASASDADDSTEVWVRFGARRLVINEHGVSSARGEGCLEPAADGPWLTLAGDVVRGADAETVEADLKDNVREQAKRRGAAETWPEADERVLHLVRTLDAPDRVTPARLKTLIRQIGSSRVGPVVTFLFSEGIVPVEHAMPVLGPDGVGREARLRAALIDAETELDRIDEQRAFELTRALAVASGVVVSS